MNAQELLADIRNKMTPVSLFITLAAQFYDADPNDIQEKDRLEDLVIKQLEDAEKSFEYLKTIKL